jgi:DNA-binding response OmpR family regulator
VKDILVVEDSVEENERLKQLFEGAGYAVMTCRSVGDAEQVIGRHQFRLAILDIGLGDRSGSHFFNTIKRTRRASNVIIFTGNPSVHLKQRFLAEGAADFIVKASTAAQNKNFLARVQSLIGGPEAKGGEGHPLDEFLTAFIPETSRDFFRDMNGGYPACRECGSREYRVTFGHQAQMPPEIVGQVVCAHCGRPMDADVG